MGLVDDLEGASPSYLLWRVQRGNPTRTSEEDSITLAFACERVIRHVSALQLRYLTRAVVSEHAVDMRDEKARYDYFTGIEVVGAEIAPMLGLSKVVAQQKVATACDLVRELPKIVALLEDGEIDLQRAASVDDVMREVLQPDDPLWRRIEEAVAGEISGRTNTTVRAKTRRTIDEADPSAADRRHCRARNEREVRVYPIEDGMGAVTATLPRDGAEIVDAVLDALADGCRDRSRAVGTPDPRTHQQRRADAFVALFRSVAQGTPLPVVAARTSETTNAHAGPETDRTPTTAMKKSPRPTTSEGSADARTATSEGSSGPPSDIGAFGGSFRQVGDESERVGASSLSSTGSPDPARDPADPGPPRILDPLVILDPLPYPIEISLATALLAYRELPAYTELPVYRGCSAGGCRPVCRRNRDADRTWSSPCPGPR
jgi:hypothetical protein